MNFFSAVRDILDHPLLAPLTEVIRPGAAKARAAIDVYYGPAREKFRQAIAEGKSPAKAVVASIEAVFEKVKEAPGKVGYTALGLALGGMVLCTIGTIVLTGANGYLVGTAASMPGAVLGPAFGLACYAGFKGAVESIKNFKTSFAQGMEKAKEYRQDPAAAKFRRQNEKIARAEAQKQQKAEARRKNRVPVAERADADIIAALEGMEKEDRLALLGRLEETFNKQLRNARAENSFLAQKNTGVQRQARP